ncbi:MAG: CDP-alcohol phosphatidyltransferase family protein [Sphingomicrobium sp.]|nr:CDP-alcohol phosphatidyltransferase family protein [Sphingomonadales bacterium]
MLKPGDPGVETLTRIQQNLLARAERKILTGLCRRMPMWVTPDILTGIGVFGAIVIFAGYAASTGDAAFLWLAIAGYGVQWFGDSMDGSLARYRRIERPSFGYFLDHSCDGLTSLLILCGIGLSPFVRLDVALLALAGYLLLSIHAYLAARVLGELKLSYLNAGPTELRLALILLTLAMMIGGEWPILFGRVSVFDLIVGGVGLLLIALFVVQTIATANRLAAFDEDLKRNS